MPKTIYLVRHAKSSWKDAILSDYDRPLNKRGKQNAPEMGQRLAEKAILPDWLLSSPAKRAKHTAQAMASALGYPENKIHWLEELYHASSNYLLSQLQNISDQYESVMLVGHNPGLTELQNILCADKIDTIVTAGIVCIQFETDDWPNIHRGYLQWYDYPKKEK